jgi:NRPS condensation-like uncharacterized protein
MAIPRDRLGEPLSALREVSRRIGEHKRRLPGLSYSLLPLILFGWLPHGLLRLAGRRLLTRLMGFIGRALAVTNIGSLDEALAPLGDDATAASIIGPFVHGLALPIVTATGFRGTVTLQVGSTGTLAEVSLGRFAADLARLLDEIADLDGQV